MSYDRLKNAIATNHLIRVRVVSLVRSTRIKMISIEVPDSVKRNIEKASKRLAEKFKTKKWDAKHIDVFDPLKLSPFALGNCQFELLYPGFIYLSEEADSEPTTSAMCGDLFVPIGACGNGDLIAYCANRGSSKFLKNGSIYFICHELFEKDIELEKYVRFVSSSLREFIDDLPRSVLPSDCFEPSAISPTLKYEFKEIKKPKRTKK